jgi:hypothetical protein
MCFEIPVEAKAEPAVGFPDGWRFYFAKAYTAKGLRKYRAIPTLWILSPGGKPFRSVEAAVGSNLLDDPRDEIGKEFYEHVGFAVVGASSHPTKNQVAASQSSLSKYRVVGSRVYCRVEKQAFWGIIEEKFQLGANRFQYSVSIDWTTYNVLGAPP